MMTLTNGNAAVIIDNWRRDHEFVIIASSILKRCVFSCLLKLFNVGAALKLCGSEFHAVSPACEKARSPNYMTS